MKCWYRMHVLGVKAQYSHSILCLHSLSRDMYSKTCLKRTLKRSKIGFQDRLSFNVGQKYCRMLQGKHSAILSTFINLPSVINIFVLSILEWLLKTDLTVLTKRQTRNATVTFIMGFRKLTSLQILNSLLLFCFILKCALYEEG